MAEHPMSGLHRFVLKVEDGYTSWRLICPDDESCTPADACGSCGRNLVEPERDPCYDCKTRVYDPDGECWAQTWVGEMTAEEALHGTVEISVPVNVQWTGDGLECEVAGAAEVLP